MSPARTRRPGPPIRASGVSRLRSHRTSKPGDRQAAYGRRVDNHPDPEGARYAALVGIDRALRHVNVTVASRLARSGRRPRFRRSRSFVAARGRLDSGAAGGALLPRLVARGRHEGNLSHKRELFANVLRVPADWWERAGVTWVGEGGAIHRGDLSAGLLVGCVPVISDPAEIELPCPGGRRASLLPDRRGRSGGERGADPAVSWPRSTVAGVVTRLAPELTLTPTLLAAWQQALRSPDRGSTRLRLLVPGSGALTAAGGRASNTAVLLDGRTGAVIARQRKLFAFDFDATELERWNSGAPGVPGGRRGPRSRPQAGGDRRGRGPDRDPDLRRPLSAAGCRPAGPRLRCFPRARAGVLRPLKARRWRTPPAISTCAKRARPCCRTASR